VKKAEALKILNEITLNEIGVGDQKSLNMLHNMLADLMGGGYDFYSDSVSRNDVREEYTKNFLTHKNTSDTQYKAAKVIVDFLTEVEKQERTYEQNMKRMEKLLSIVQEEVQLSQSSAEIF